jgi:hypothetical protein
VGGGRVLKGRKEGLFPEFFLFPEKESGEYLKERPACLDSTPSPRPVEVFSIGLGTTNFEYSVKDTMIFISFLK